MDAREASLYSKVITNGSYVYEKGLDDLWYKSGSDEPYGIEELRGPFLPMRAMATMPKKDKWDKFKETGYAPYAPVEPIKKKDKDDLLCLSFFTTFNANGDRGLGGTADDSVSDYIENFGGSDPTKTVHIVLNVSKSSIIPKVNLSIDETYEVSISDLVD